MKSSKNTCYTETNDIEQMVDLGNYCYRVVVKRKRMRGRRTNGNPALRISYRFLYSR